MSYLRELEHARRDVRELRDLLGASGDPPDVSLSQLMQAIGLALMIQCALIDAEKTRPTDPGDLT